VSDGFRRTINNTLVNGDGLGKPQGILHPSSGIPICETSPSTPPGTFSWQDMVALKYEVPQQWQAGASYLLNERTFALLMSMSDTANRPLWNQLPGGQPGFQFAGAPINIVSQLPDVASGATPVCYGNWSQAYTLVTRKAISMTTDPFSAGGWCTLFRFDCRLGRATTCSNAARLLRIR